MKKILVAVFVSLILFVGFGFIAPRPIQKICTTNLDCGFDAGGTDIMDVKGRGYPLTSYKTEVTREHVLKTLDVVTQARSTYSMSAMVLNILFWGTLTFVIFFIVEARKRHAHNRH